MKLIKTRQNQVGNGVQLLEPSTERVPHGQVWVLSPELRLEENQWQKPSQGKREVEPWEEITIDLSVHPA